MLLITHLKVLPKALDIGTKRLILFSKLFVEILLEVQVSLHVCHLAIPVVELATLL